MGRSSYRGAVCRARIRLLGHRPTRGYAEVVLAVVQKRFSFIQVPLNPFPSLSHHLVARVYESKAEFRSALQHEKEGYTIYKNQVRSCRGDTQLEQTLESPLSRDGAELLPCTITDWILCQKSSNSLAESWFLLDSCPWTETHVGGVAPRSHGPLRAALSPHVLHPPPVCEIPDPNEFGGWAVRGQCVLPHGETPASARALPEHVCRRTR